MYIFGFLQTTTPSTSIFCVDANEHLTYPILESSEGVMSVLNYAVPGATLRSLMFQGDVPRQRLTQIAVSHSSHI